MGAAWPQVLRAAFFSSDDADGLSAARDSLMRGPDDSHYEFSAVFDAANESDDSQVELPAFSMEAAVADAADSDVSLGPAGSEESTAVPWYYTYIESWGRLHLLAALGFAASTLSVLGFLLLSALAGGPIVDAPITALIVGCVGMVAFVLLTVSVAAVVALLADLGKKLRQLNFRAAGNFPNVGEHTPRNRPNLTRSVG
jgi:hypothetical protein